MKILHLTLSKKPFEVMVTGEKQVEYRQLSRWMFSRLVHNGVKKEYDVVKFVNGYGNDKPYFIAKFKGHGLSEKYETITYSNGLSVLVIRNDIEIYLGKIIEKGNL